VQRNVPLAEVSLLKKKGLSSQIPEDSEIGKGGIKDDNNAGPARRQIEGKGGRRRLAVIMKNKRGTFQFFQTTKCKVVGLGGQVTKPSSLFMLGKAQLGPKSSRCQGNREVH